MKNKKNYLDNIPVIRGDIVWEEKEGQVVIEQQHRGLYAFIAQKIYGKPKVSHVSLDEFGSFVWMSIDGVKTIYDIGVEVSDHFGKAVEPLYERLSRYFFTLKDVNFIEFKKQGKK